MNSSSGLADVFCPLISLFFSNEEPRREPSRKREGKLIASLTISGIGPSLVLEGATDTQAFTLYIEPILAPTLRPGQRALLDNLSAHTAPRIRALIEALGCRLWFLPPYSPDLSPIELAFAKIKAASRRIGARTRPALEDAIETALKTVTAAEARAFFTHCGYRLRPDWDHLLSTLL